MKSTTLAWNQAMSARISSLKLMADETQVNCLTGGAAGLIGHKDGSSLVMTD